MEAESDEVEVEVEVADSIEDISEAVERIG
jgi:hypothetical protein